MSNDHGQKLAGKIAVVTGGSSGIGLSTAKRFVGRRCPRSDHWATRERAEGGRSLHQEKRYNGPRRRIALGRSGPPLCHCERKTWSHRHTLCERGGAGTVAPLVVATEAHFDQTFDVNVKECSLRCRRPFTLQRRWLDVS